MTKLLVANGCSFTRGEELQRPESQAWPAQLAERLGVPCVNLARNASSNRRIVRSTVMRLESIRREHGLRCEDVAVVIAWTQTARHEYHSSVEPVPQEGPPDHPVDEGWHRVGPWLLGRGHKPTKAFYDLMWSEEGALVNFFLDWTQTARHEYHSSVEPVPQEGPPDHPVDEGWHRVGPWLLGRGHKPTKAFYDLMWSEEGALVNFFLDWTLLDGYLSAHGYDARYSFAFPVTDPIPEHAKPLMDALDGDRVWGGLPAAPERSFVNMPPRFSRGPGGHPLADGHAWFADSLATWIETR